MPNVVDELVVILNLDASSFTQNQKRALESFRRTKEDAATTAKDLEARGKQAGEFYGQINRQALGLFATLAGAGTLGKFVANTVSDISAVGRVSKVIGESTQNVQAMRLTLRAMNEDADAGTQAFLNMSQAMQRWNAGLGGDLQQLTAWQQLGGASTDSMTQLWRKLAVYSDHNSAQNVQLWGAQAGFSEGQIQEALKGSKQFDVDRAQALKSVPTDAQVKKVQDLQHAFGGLKNSVLGSAQAMVEDGAPSLTGLLNLVTAGTLKFPELTKAVLAYLAALIAINSLKLVGGGFGLISKLGGGAAKVAPGVVGGAIGRTIGAAGILAFVPGQIRDTVSELKGPEAWAADERARLGIKAPPDAISAAHDAAAKVAIAKAVNEIKPGQFAPGLTLGPPPPTAAPAAGGLQAFSPGLTLGFSPPTAAPAAGKGDRSVPKASPRAPTGRVPLSIRSNNPGNLTDPKTHKFRHFDTLAEGYDAMAWQIERDYSVHGNHTPRQFINDPAWGWSNDKDPRNTKAGVVAYYTAIAKALGIGIDDDMKLAGNPKALGTLMTAQARVESGQTPTDLIRNAAMAAALRVTSGTQVNIGTINVNGANITDPRSFAGGVGRALKNVQLANQANSAVN